MPSIMVDKPEGLADLIQQHLNWYPRMELRDIYKLLYQGVMGAEPLISSSKEFTLNLRAEFERVHPYPHERLLEPVRPDQSMLRLNLRPYKSLQPQMDGLVSPLLQTASSFSGDLPELKVTWKGFVGLCEQDWFANFSTLDIHQFTSWLEELEYPAVHHSERYRKEYQPAYRLIAAELLSTAGLENAG